MYIQVFIMFLLAQSEYCASISQPLQQHLQTNSSSVNHKSNILSLINDAGNCTAYKVLISKLSFYSEYLSYCDRPISAPTDTHKYVDYGLALCMVLYESADRVCKMKDHEDKPNNEEVTNLKQNISSDVFCNEINKTLPAPSTELARPFVSFLKAKFENISNCEQACLQDTLINPICMYILSANMFTVTNNEDISLSGNPESQVKSQGHGKENETSIKKAKDFQKETGDPTSAAGPELSKRKQEQTETAHNDKKTQVTHKIAGHKPLHNHSEANADITKSNSAVDMQTNVTKEIHIKKSNNHSDEVTGINTTSSLNKNTKLGLGAEKHEGSSEKTADPESKGSAASISENKPSGGVDLTTPEAQNKNVDNKESVLPNEKKYKPSGGVDLPNAEAQNNVDSKESVLPNEKKYKPSGGVDLPNPEAQNSVDNKESVLPNEKKYKPSGGVDLTTPEAQNKNVDNKESVLPNEKKYKHSGGVDLTNPEAQNKNVDSKESVLPNEKKYKPSGGVDLTNPEDQNKNVDNKESVVPTEKKYNKSQNTDMVYNKANDDEHEQSEDSTNVEIPVDQIEQSEQAEQDEQAEQTEQGEGGEEIPKENEHQEEAANGNTAQFNQLGDAEDSHFYAYFMTMVVICIIGYLVFHNKQKILALALEGRSRRGTRRRPNTSAYRKLDSNLEEAVTSTCSTSVTHVIY
ncbi:hypothetical protein B7P43_G13182 [Cryptotermes secundus]|uniref:Trans-Golgi network integral membrane protein 2 n=1 Tax=Cryptotermes secundus TaxID=105785 RepID=A0A2J7Q447_9NEOP|nr:uncharacterized protein LOC111869927 [Cryptotermes secundus]PNF23354.1 hypothetical protein B7P43_G13182 [Cryptotermes secundus]